MSILHSQLLCPLIHSFYKLLLTSSNMLCHCHACIIPGGDHNTFDHCFHILCLSFFQEHLGATHGFGICTGSHCVCKLQIPICQTVKDQQKSHDLCNAGRASFLFLAFFIQHRSCICLYQNPCRSLDQYIFLYTISLLVFLTVGCKHSISTNHQNYGQK